MQLHINKLRVAGILDDLSEVCLSYDVKFLNLTFENWAEELEMFMPDLLFIESAWHGVKDKWYKQVYNCSREVLGVINWCRERNIPTVFWNKEDPVHFDTFLGFARLFDYVYTTDMDCVPLYRKMLRHNNVWALPFAVCPRMFNPIEKYERQHAVCFAGGHYALQKERCEDFDNIYDACTELLPFYIYDRNVYPGNPDYTFPAKYTDSILGSLPVSKIDIAYKGYDYALTMNTVKHSSTMEARRIFELLACNTISISNQCTGIKNLLGDLVIQYEDKESFMAQLTESENHSKLRLLGLRKVLNEHTYYRRWMQVCRDVFPDREIIDDTAPCVGCIGVVRLSRDIKNLLKNYDRLNYDNKVLIIISDGYEIDSSICSRENVYVVNSVSELEQLKVNCEYYSVLHPNDYYGKSYLRDLTLSLSYSNVPLIGKAAYYEYTLGTLSLRSKHMQYRIVEKMSLRRCIFASRLLRHLPVEAILTGGEVFGFSALSTDCYNYCENYGFDSLEAVEDLTGVNTGYSMDEVCKACSNLPSDICSTTQLVYSARDILDINLCDNDSFAVEPFADDCCAIFCSGNQNKLYYARATEIMRVDEYAIDNWIRICFDGTVANGGSVGVVFLTDEEKVIKTIALPAGRYQRCPVPENACKFYIHIKSAGRGCVIIRSIVLNAIPGKEINISDFLTEEIL